MSKKSSTKKPEPKIQEKKQRKDRYDLKWLAKNPDHPDHHLAL